MTPTGAPTWLRAISAILTAWCAFWAFVDGFSTTLLFLAYVTGLEFEIRSPTMQNLYFGFLLLLAAAIVFVITRWQWREMRTTSGSNHSKLIGVLILAGLALAYHPFFIAQF